ncbi:MAG: PilW family protein, partial [Candidatus Methylomirabilales bacterium]
MTLIETLISSALFAFVIVGVYMLHTTMQSTWHRGEMKTDLQQNARVGLDRLVRDLRMAGYDPQGALAAVNTPPRAALRAASPTCLAFVTYDVSRSAGALTPYSVQVSYYRDGSVLRRRQDAWDASTSAFTAGVPEQLATATHFFSFTFFDPYNMPLVPAPVSTTLRCPPAAASAHTVTLLTLDQLAQVRRIA